MGIFRHLLPTFMLLFLLGSCSGFSTIKRGDQKVILFPGSSVSIENQFCNTLLCVQHSHILHQKTRLALEAFLTTHGHRIVTQGSSDFRIVIISAFEEKIEAELPRNLFLLVFDKQGNEVFQVGLSSHFSGPLTPEFLSFQALEQEVNQLINVMFLTSSFVAGRP